MFLDEILSMNETKGNDSRIAFDNFVRQFHKNNQSAEGIQYNFKPDNTIVENENRYNIDITEK